MNSFFGHFLIGGCSNANSHFPLLADLTYFCLEAAQLAALDSSPPLMSLLLRSLFFEVFFFLIFVLMSEATTGELNLLEVFLSSCLSRRRAIYL